MSLTPHQIKLLHVARSKVSMDEDSYRALLSRYGARSSKDKALQPAHYHEMMQVFAGMGFTPSPRPGTPAGGTKAQVREIERLCREHQVEAKRLAGIVAYVTHKDAAPSAPLRWCGRKDLSKVIQALRNWQWGQA
jgi:phage gp16-like protein